ncbi:MAG: hypothetical protein OEX07_13635 [Gammaproteobacteria bacterium]|nr:hypothetical protein [Gammaproteobacteria bacterium]
MMTLGSSRFLLPLCMGIIMVLSGCNDEQSSSAQSTAYVKFTNGQAATVVIGQDDFISSGAGLSDSKIYNPYTNSFVADDGSLYIPDWSNNRILVFGSIPTSNGAQASLVIGQPDFVTANNAGASATELYGPVSPVVSGDKLFVLGWSNNRAAIYNSVPTESPGTIDVVLGQPDKTSSGPGCSATSLNKPESLWVADGKMFVADGANNRVLIWSSIPTADATPPDYVLGQYDMDLCEANGDGLGAGTLNFPTAVWSDGKRIVVSDTSNNRVLIWNSFPAVNGQDADIVLGQSNFFTTGANRGGSVAGNTLSRPYEGLHVANDQLIVTDEINNRVLIWNTFPTESGQPADVVIGQADLVSDSSGTTSITLNKPNGVHLHENKLIVTDRVNQRVLVYEGEWAVH